MQIQISWLLQKPTDLDLHCLQRQSISGFSRTRVKLSRTFVCQSVQSAVFSFLDDSSGKLHWIVSTLGTLCVLIMLRSGLGLLMGNFCQFLTELSAHHDSGRVLLVQVFIV